MTSRYTTATLLMFSAVVLPAQQPSATTVQKDPSGYTLSVNAKLVSLDIVVTDAKGNPVDGLKQEDFRILEGTTPETIRSFEPPESHFLTPNVSIQSTGELDRKAPDAPVTIIVLDEANTRFEDEAFARYSIKKYLDTQPEHLTQPTELVAIDVLHFTVLRDYTTSKSEILSALNHHLQANPWRLDAGWEAEQFDKSFEALVQVAKAVAGHPGHKSMIWIGHGVPTLTLDSTDPDSLQKISDMVQSTIDLLKNGRIALYTVDPAGVKLNTSTDINGFNTDDDPFGSSVDFQTMAKATGGFALFGRNDVDKLIGQAEQAGSHFYTLTYRPQINDAPKAFRAIHVIVTKSGLLATTREGYYESNATPPHTTAKEETIAAGVDLLTASENQMVYDGLPIGVRRDLDHPGRFIVHLEGSAVEWQQNTDPPTIALSLLIASFDRKGKVIQRIAKQLHLHGSPSTDGIAHHPSLDLVADINTAKASRVRIIVRNNATGKIGAQNIPCTNETCNFEK